MCGGVTYNLETVPEEELDKFYSKKDLEYFRKSGMISSFFWDKRPVLPVVDDGKVSLFDWGNRDKNAPLPKTGWAKEETLDKGKWDWLHPKKVSIPVKKGYEKKVWFDFKNGTNGILVEKEGDKRVYIITTPADKKYLSETRHDRMPLGKKLNFQKDKKYEKRK